MCCWTARGKLTQQVLQQRLQICDCSVAAFQYEGAAREDATGIPVADDLLDKHLRELEESRGKEL